MPAVDSGLLRRFAPRNDGDGDRTMTSKSLFYDESHDAFRATVRRFVEKEIAPYVDEWDEAGGFPRELYRKAADVGILGLGYPGGIRRLAVRPVPSHRAVAGTRARGLRRRVGEPDEPHHRLAADRGGRPRGDEEARAAAGAGGREDFGARDHRTVRRLRRRATQDDGAARRRSLHRQRLEDVHHVGRARGFLHGRRAHRRSRARAACRCC